MLPAVRTAPALVRHCARPLSTRLTTALDGTPADSPTHLGSGDVHATTLENGLRVVSVETYSPSSVVGLVVKAGARYEDGLPYGTAHTLSRLAYKSTSRTTSFRRTVDIENQCESFTAAAGREQLRFVGTLPRANVADFVSTSLFDSLSLTAHEYEVLEVEQTIRDDTHQTVRSRLLNALYREAYDDRAIGRPVVPCSAWPLPDNEDVRNFVEKTHHASRTALVGVGVDHQQLVDLAREAFTATSQPDQPAAAAAAATASDYTGGRIRVPAPGVPSFVAIAFNGKGVSGAHLLAISKLFNVSDKIEGFSEAWSDAALTGLIVNNADQQLAVERIRSLKNASNDALKNAITAARAQTAWQLGTRKGTWEVLAGHAFLNHQLSTKALLESLEQLTAEQLRQSVASVLASPPTIASIGRSDNIIRSV